MHGTLDVLAMCSIGLLPAAAAPFARLLPLLQQLILYNSFM
jgi:hypothetical protein